MNSYFFKAVASDGKLRSGSISAASDGWVAQELRRQGLTPVYVGLEKPKSSYSLKLPSLGRGRRRDVLFFTQELSTLLNSGVPLDRALAISTELTERPGFRLLLSDVLRVLKGGRSLADSLATHPECFSELYINMVRAGEASGSLTTVFERLAEFERTRDDLRNFIVSSMVYPILLACVGLGSVLLLMFFVVPRFAAVFEGGRIPMPTPMRIMLETSRFLETWAWVGLAAIAGLVVSFRAWVGTPAGRFSWDSFRLRLPLLGDAIRKAETARFARAMSTLVANSVPLVQSIGIAGAILNNRRIAQSLEKVAQGIKRGEGIATPLRRVGEFPPLAGHLLSVGEETGRLDQMFARMADIYEGDTRAAIKRLTTLFEPIVILVMGLLVGAFILSMLMAITSINEVSI